MEKTDIAFKREQKFGTFDLSILLFLRSTRKSLVKWPSLRDSILSRGKSRRTRIYLDTPDGRFSRQGDYVQRLRLTRYENSDFFLEIKYERQSKNGGDIGKVRIPLFQLRDLAKFLSGEKLKPDFDCPKCDDLVYTPEDLNPQKWEEKREYILREIGKSRLVVLAASSYTRVSRDGHERDYRITGDDKVVLADLRELSFSFEELESLFDLQNCRKEKIPKVIVEFKRDFPEEDLPAIRAKYSLQLYPSKFDDIWERFLKEKSVD